MMIRIANSAFTSLYLSRKYTACAFGGGINRYPCDRNRPLVGICRLRDYSALTRLALRVALQSDRRHCVASSNRLVYVGGSNKSRQVVWDCPTLSGPLVGICRLRDSNPRPTVYKTVALPLC